MRTLPLISGLALIGLLAVPAKAQSRLVQRFDTNKDGKVSRDEIPEGATRRMFDNLVERHKLDPAKTYSISELEKIIEVSPARADRFSQSPPTNPSGFSRSGPSTRPGSTGSSTPPRSATDGRPYRSVVELPAEYKAYDKNGDGQIGLYEWPRERIREFLALDRNDDGFLTPSELKSPSSPDSSKGKPSGSEN